MSIADRIRQHNERVTFIWRTRGSDCKPYTPSTVPALPTSLSRVLVAAEHGGSLIEFPMAEEPTSRTLTGREMDILRLTVDGMSNKEIARALDIAEATVKMHRRKIYLKMDAKNAAHSVAIALRTGLVPLEVMA